MLQFLRQRSSTLSCSANSYITTSLTFGASGEPDYHINSYTSDTMQCILYALNINCSSPKSFLPLDTPRIGDAGGNVPDHDEPTSKADDDQTPAHGGEDGPLAPQVLASDGVADEQVAVEDDPHREKSVPRYQAPLGETEDILAKCWKQFYCVKTLHCAIPLQNWKLAISKVLTNKGLVFAQLLSKYDHFSYDW